MTSKYLFLLSAVLLVSACNRQSSHPSASTGGPAQAASPSPARDPEPVERVGTPGAPPVTARVVEEPSKPGAQPEIVIPASTRIHVRLVDSLDSKTSRRGERFTAYLDEPIVSDGRVERFTAYLDE